MDARLVLEDRPGAWVEFSSRGREFRARFDPMWLGPDGLCDLLRKPFLVRKLMDEKSKMSALIADPMGKYVRTLAEDYADAVGLGLRGLAVLNHALENIGLVEVDLLARGLDVRDWLDPEGSLSSRRVALLVEDFLARPETCIGAKRFDVEPITREGIVLAQWYSGMAGEDFTHPFLKSPLALEEEAEQRRVDSEKRERMGRSRLSEIGSTPGGGGFDRAREESRRQLEEILASQGGEA